MATNNAINNSISTSIESWTPVVTFSVAGDLSVSYAIQAGTYSIVGNIITLICELQFTPTYTTASGNLQIMVPFLSNSMAGNFAVGGLEVQNPIFPTGSTSLSSRLGPGSNLLLFVASGTGVASQPFTTTQIPSGTMFTLIASITYLV